MRTASLHETNAQPPRRRRRRQGRAPAPTTRTVAAALLAVTASTLHLILVLLVVICGLCLTTSSNTRHASSSTRCMVEGFSISPASVSTRTSTTTTTTTRRRRTRSFFGTTTTTWSRRMPRLLLVKNDRLAGGMPAANQHHPRRYSKDVSCHVLYAQPNNNNNDNDTNDNDDPNDNDNKERFFMTQESEDDLQNLLQEENELVEILETENDDDDDDESEEIVDSYNDDDDDDDDEEEYYYQEQDWDEEEDGKFYELEDDGTDPNYTKQRKLLEASIAARQEQKSDEEFDAVDFVLNNENGRFTEDQMKMLDQLSISKKMEEMTQNMQLVKDDVDWENLERDVRNVGDIMDDPYPVHEEGEENVLENDVGITDQDMLELQDAWTKTQDAENMEPWDRVMAKNEMSDAWDHLSNETLQEMDDCLEEIGGSAYNVTRWLLYDLDFNVTNLILSAIQHNKEAPILFQHWYPQLLTYSRYKAEQDRNFDFTWHDVQSADLSELERYYAGFGYDEIPTKLPGETGIISLEDLDEEEIKMAAFESWMTDVYNPEWDRKDFDDDDLRDEDNVFSKYFEPPQHPDVPVYEDVQQDLAEWDEEMGDDEEDREHKEFMGRDFQYQVIQDEEFQKEFRGHLVVACTGADSDLEVAEKITLRMTKEFGKKVFVETRVIAHARDDDNVFEIWLESYEIDLLHSKKRASMNTKGWDGPVECDNKQIDWLVDRVGFLISDDVRYSYRYEMAEAD